MFMLVERLRSGHHIYLCVGLFFVVKTECVCENEFSGHMCVFTPHPCVKECRPDVG